jgi:hypothetical protein
MHFENGRNAAAVDPPAEVLDVVDVPQAAMTLAQLNAINAATGAL